MAKFTMELPEETINQLTRIYDQFDTIVGKMVKAGAKVVYKNVKANLPQGIRKSGMMKCLKITKTYKTPSDGATNIKIGFYGYFTNENGKQTPAPMVANIFEYGRSNAPYPKQPFFRQAFNASEIEKAMLAEQEKASGGILKNE